ncbi:hypothetical protein RM550_11180 [Streptomyces sp. DSM 41527]|uniref:PPE domain-containing protein n=1 Tax=Streptomyces mooreae TaxID=3075523 RepID=A0ABU2T7S0_9ACTN|nr:hypothetical protein [Streptomyces sp. DSM 41527]MDT0456300.1 hypothetical protein [Streptomyces sp. DSM 41527]
MAGNSVDLGIQGCTNFENASHQALYDMVADGDHLLIVAMGADLVDAGKEIARITDDLEAYARQTQAHWKGEGARAFDDWTKATATESRKLGHYAKNTGEAMTDAATALGQAKLMPKPPQLRNFVETDSAKPNGVTALTKDPAREEALAEMNRLASYYRTAQAKIAQQETPNFRPASGFVPEPPLEDERISNDQVLDRPAVSGTTNGPGRAGVAAASGNSSVEQHGEAPRSPGEDPQPDRQVGTSVDSTAPVAPAQPSTSHPGTSPHRPGGSDGFPEVPPTSTTVPGAAKIPGGRGRAEPGSQNPTGHRAVTPRGPGRAAGDGIVGATPQRGNTSPGRPRLPGGTVMGEEHGVNAPRPAGPGALPPAKGNGMTPRDAGGPSQRFAPERGEAMDRSRGPVMGEERGAARGVPGGGIPGNTRSSMRPDVRGLPGRRLAYEPGGSVGGAGPSVPGKEQGFGAHAPVSGKSNAGSAAAGTATGTPAPASRNAEPGRTAGRTPMPRGRSNEFTPGGSGLTRAATPSNGVLPTAGPPSQRRKGTSGQRPDYLREDDETWTAQHPSAVPPVIE